MPYIDFKTLKKRVSIVKILQHYELLDTLTETKDGYQGPCPLHDGGGTSTFMVNTDRNIWFCFGECKDGEKDGGNILDFVVRWEGVPIRKAAQRITSWFPENGSEEPVKGDTEVLPEVRSAVTEDSEKPDPLGGANTPLGFELKDLDHTHPYLTETLGFQSSTMEHFGVGYFPRKGSMQGRIVIPIHNASHELVAYAGRKPDDALGVYKYPEKFILPLELFNLFRLWRPGKAYDDGSVIIVLDFFDVFRCYEAGFGNVVALLGETLSPAQHAMLSECHLGRKVTLLLPSSLEPRIVVELVDALIGTFYVRLVRPAIDGIQSVADLPAAELRAFIRGTDSDQEVLHARAG